MIRIFLNFCKFFSEINKLNGYKILLALSENEYSGIIVIDNFFIIYVTYRNLVSKLDINLYKLHRIPYSAHDYLNLELESFLVE